MYRENSIVKNSFVEALKKAREQDELSYEDKLEKDLNLALQRLFNKLDKIVKKVYLTGCKITFSLRPHWYSFKLTELNPPVIINLIHSKMEEKYGDFAYNFTVCADFFSIDQGWEHGPNGPSGLYSICRKYRGK